MCNIFVWQVIIFPFTYYEKQEAILHKKKYCYTSRKVIKNFMKKSTKKAFTLVEMMISISIFMLLMVSVSLFVTQWVKNLTFQKKIIDSSTKELNFFKKLQEYLNAGEKVSLLKTFSSGALLKIDKNLFIGWFVYIGEFNFSWETCFSDSPHQNTNNLIMTSFFPFEWQWGDFFSGTSFSSAWLEVHYFSPSIKYNGTSFTGNIVGPTNAFLTGSELYLSDTKGNQILQFDINNTSSPWLQIIWNGNPWDGIISWEQGTDIFLNSPTWITVVDGKIFVSDTLNDRIIYYDIPTRKTYTFLERKDGLDEPTGLLYDDTKKRLYIVNSGKWEILKVDAGNLVAPPSPKFTFEISPSITINKIFLSFFSASWTPINLSSPINPTDFIFSWITQEEDFSRINGNTLEYYFANYTNSETSQVSCISAWDYILNSWNPIKCTTTWTGIVGTLQDKTLSWNNYSIDISNLTWNFSATGSYYTRISFLNGGSEVYSLYKPYFTKGDDNLLTFWDNILSSFSSWYHYPTGIYKIGSNIIINDFSERKKYFLDEDTGTNSLPSSDLLSFDFSFLKNYTQKSFLKSPTKNFSISESAWLVSLYLEYYKNFSCYDDELNIVRTFLFKKFLQN